MHVNYTCFVKKKKKKKEKVRIFLLIFFHCLRSRIVYDNGAAISLKSRGYCFEMFKGSLIIALQTHSL